MVAYVFDRILAKGVRAGQLPARTQGARDWFREAARKTSASPEGIMRGADKSDFANSGAFGAMFMFYYDPKHKATLPYYDTFIGGPTFRIYHTNIILETFKN